MISRFALLVVSTAWIVDIWSPEPEGGVTRTSTEEAETVIEKLPPAPVVSLASTAEVETSSASTTAPDTGDPPALTVPETVLAPAAGAVAEKHRRSARTASSPVRTAERRPRSGFVDRFPDIVG